ncbi:MAG TPA: flagellar assembly protein FliW [Rhodocyclaceae bacterium]|jgi:flagellar assembly factor FliW
MNEEFARIESPRFGTLEISPERIIEFPNGIPGFEDIHRYSLFHPETEDPKYFILQAVDNPDVAFHIADPSRFGFTYEIELSDEESNIIGLEDPADVVVVVMLLKDAILGNKPLRANLNAPLVLNLKTRKGLQHVFAELNYQVTLKDSSNS